MNQPKETAVKPDKKATDSEPVKIESRLISRIGNREWGLPTLRMPGQIWRSEKNKTITCMTPGSDDRLNIETRLLEIIPIGHMSQMPDSWRDSMWEYVQEWPSSGCGLGPFLRITKQQRCDFIRKMSESLCKSDNIGCCSIAHDIGMFAAWGYELSKSKDGK